MFWGVLLSPSIDRVGYLDTLGWVLFRMGEYQHAREVLEKAIGLNSFLVFVKCS